MSTVTVTAADSVLGLQTLDELVMHLGNIPPSRIPIHPQPGTATSADALEVARREGKLCEVIDGVLVEKPMGYYESRIALILGRYLDEYLEQNDLGIATGADGPLHVNGGQLR